MTVPTAPRLSANGIVVRPQTAADVGPLCAAVQQSMESVGRWMAWCHSGYSMADAEAWYARCTAGWVRDGDREFGIFSADTGEVLGCVGVNQINRVHLIANLGYWVRTTREGRGIATAAARLVARFAFAELTLARLEIVVEPHNVASRRVAEKLGAQFECIARHRMLWRDGPRDAAVYSLLPSDLALRRGARRP
jgi:ribosomal-protein-serine acetyltransferase